MDEFEDGLRERLLAAADEIRRATPLADPEPALRRGLFLRRLHVASLAGTAAAAVLALVVVANQIPTASTTTADQGLSTLVPTAIESALPTLIPSPTPSMPLSPSPKPSPTPRPTDSPSPNPTTSPRPVPPGACDPYPQTKPPAGIQVTLKTAKTTFVRGEPIALHLVVQNTGVTPVTHEHPSGQQYDFWVTDGRGTIWKWSAGKVFTQALMKETIGPGEKREASEAWPQTRCGDGLELEAGTYTAWALWTTLTDEGTHGWWSNPVRMTIV